MIQLSILAIGFVLNVLVGAGLGFAAYGMASRQRRSLAALAERLDAALRDVARLTAELRRLQAMSPDRAGQATTGPPADIVAEIQPSLGPLEPTATAAMSEPAPEIEASPWATTEAPPPSRAAAGPRETIEQRFTARWMVWIGAVALALGGTFLVKYAIDQGWLGPTTRVVLGFVAGCLLVAGGEWLRQRPIHRAIAAIRPDYVPPALTAAGVFIAFASAYAAFELYDLLSPLVAFLVLGLLSAGAVLLALLQGPMVALLGILGGFATPNLVPSQHPSAWSLFIYLLFLCAAALGVVRYTAAWWLALVTLAGAVAWPLLWFAASWQPGDGAAIGCYLLAFGAIASLLPFPGLLAQPAPRTGLPPLDSPAGFVWLVAACLCVLCFALLRMDAYGAASLFTLTALVGLGCLFGYRAALFDGLPWLAELLTLAAVAAWHFPVLIAAPRIPGPPQTQLAPHGYEPIPLAPPETHLFLTVCVGFAAWFGIVGFAALWRRRRVPWAVISATAPVLLLAIAYWQVEDFHVAFSWALVAVALAAANVAAAAQLERRRVDRNDALALAAYAAAATAALGLGATMTLQQAWLTVALSLEVAALAWIALRLDLRPLRPIAAVMTVIVLVRLTLNHQLIDYPLGGIPAVNWILYGYGLPAAAFLLAARWFARAADDALVLLLQAGALVFASLLVTLEIHILLAGSLRTPRTGLLEPSLQSAAWLAIAVGLAARGRWSLRPVAVWGGRLLVAAAVAQVLFVQVLWENPLWNRVSVGSVPVFDVLLLAYGLPALLLLAWDRLAVLGRWAAWGCFVFSLALAFLNVSLEVRHGFHGAFLSGASTSDAEWYSYSAAWLVLAAVLLIAGIRTGGVGLRYGSLGILVITVVKVFVSDMADLTGLYRVASFFGLGLCLIGVGYLYQRFVFPAPGTDGPATAGSDRNSATG